MWVLDAVYGLGPEKIAKAVEMLLEHRELTIQEPDTVTAALRTFQLWGSGSVSLGLPLGEAAAPPVASRGTPAGRGQSHTPQEPGPLAQREVAGNGPTTRQYPQAPCSDLRPDPITADPRSGRRARLFSPRPLRVGRLGMAQRDGLSRN